MSKEKVFVCPRCGNDEKYFVCTRCSEKAERIWFDKGISHAVEAERLRNKKTLNCMLATLRKEYPQAATVSQIVYTNSWNDCLNKIEKELKEPEKEVFK